MFLLELMWGPKVYQRFTIPFKPRKTSFGIFFLLQLKHKIPFESFSDHVGEHGHHVLFMSADLK